MSVQTEPAVIKVKMAGVEFGQSPFSLETLLGSCVGVAVWDHQTKRGGLAHVVLPDSRGVATLPGKFADTAVAELKRCLVSKGVHPANLTAKIAGGSTMFGQRTDSDVGEKNYRAVLEQLKKHGIRLAGEHIGGSQGRIVHFALDDGSLSVHIARQVVAVL